MKITIVRSGGFTGIPFKKTIDTSKLPKGIQEDLRFKVQELISPHPNPLPDRQVEGDQRNTKQNMPDRFTYTISIQDVEINQSITINEEDLDPMLKKLLEL